MHVNCNAMLRTMQQQSQEFMKNDLFLVPTSLLESSDSQ